MDVSNFSFLNHKKRLRERYRNSGLSSFHDYEVLELILSYSLVRKDTKPIAKALINRFGSLTGVINATTEELCLIDGISYRSASLLKLFKDVASYHYRENIKGKNFIKSPQNVYSYFQFRFKGVINEEFWVLYLNSSYLILGDEKLFTGSTNESRIYIKELIKKILESNAVAVVIIHNHPSGKLQPSKEDLAITKRIKLALEIFEIALLDHLIIGVNDYFSFANNGYLS